MEEVEDLLQAWGLPELVPVFKANEVNIHALSALEKDDVKELIPQVGTRTLFVRSWSEWKNNFMMSNLPSCKVSLSDIQVLPLDDETTQTSPPKTITYILVEESNDNTTVTCIPEKLYPSTSNTDSLTKSVKNDLFKLLSQDFGASSLINYVGGVLPNDQHGIYWHQRLARKY